VRVYRVVLVAVMLVIVLSAGSAGATTQTKFYGASVTPASGVAANARVTFTLTLKNESNSTQSIGSANFWAPPGWAVNSVPASVQSSDLHTWNLSAQSNSTPPVGSNTDVVQFRAATNTDALAPNQSVSANIDATTSCTAGAAQWQTETKQANNFSGSSGNDFQMTAGDVNTTVAVGAAALGRFVFNPIGTQQTNHAFTVTITAYDSCGNVKTDYSGGATLTGNLTGLGNPYALSWGSNTGIGFATLMPQAAQFVAQLHIQNASASVEADSNTFEVADKATTCTSTSGPCHLSNTNENGTTTVDSPTPSGSQTLNIGLLSGGLISAFTGCSLNGPLPGEYIVTIDPSGYAASDTFTVTLTYSKSLAPGTGVANFVVCKSNDSGVTWEALSLCKNSNPAPPCILSRSRTGVGDLVETLLVSPTDPGWGTD
jgi:hypothetical protein